MRGDVRKDDEGFEDIDDFWDEESDGIAGKSMICYLVVATTADRHDALGL